MATSMKKPIRVLLVDDHKVVRSGLSTFLTVFDDLTLVGEAVNGQDAIEKCRELQPDVVLMDLMMPKMDGLEATRIIRQQFPSIQIIALTSSDEDRLVRDALQAGAIGYFLKNVDVDELAQAIRSAHAGRHAFSSEATSALIHHASAGPSIGHDLTPRERDVLSQMVSGSSNQEIADILVISRATVKFHVGSILSKLHAARRTEAVSIALQNRLVTPPPTESAR